MEARIKNPVEIFPGALKGLNRLHTSVQDAGIPATTFHLIEVRASQINGCGVCLDMHTREMRHAGEPEEKIATVASWREAPYFSEAERAALALTEAATRIADSADPVPDAVWGQAAHHYSEEQLAALVIAIASINAWNRLNAVTKQVGGEWVEQWIGVPA